MIHQHSTRRFRVGFMLTWKVKICSIVSFKAQFTRFWVLVLQVLNFPRKFQGWNLSNTTYLQKKCEKTSETLRTCKFLKWSTWLSIVVSSKIYQMSIFIYYSCQHVSCSVLSSIWQHSIRSKDLHINVLRRLKIWPRRQQALGGPSHLVST